MRKLLISVAATAFLAALPALAQPDHDHGGGGAPPAPHGGPAPQAAHGGGAPHPQPGGNPGFSRGANGGSSGRPAAPANPAYSRGPNGGAAPQAHQTSPAYTRGPNGGANFNPGGPNRPVPGGQGFNRGGPGAGQHHDFHGFVDFHQSFNAQRRFHAPAYNRPPGWYSHRWTFGEYLPSIFWGQNYWLTDYMDYALPPPPPYAVWVRYGDDALLIDQGSGEIITVEYGVFY